MDLWVNVLLDKISKNRYYSSCLIASLFLIAFSILGYSWAQSISFLYNVNYTLSVLLFTAFFLVFFPILMVQIGNSLRALLSSNEISKELLEPEAVDSLHNIREKLLSKRQFVFPLLLVLIYATYRIVWFMPQFLSNPARFTVVGHPPTTEFQIAVGVTWSFVFALIGTCLWLAYIVYKTFHTLLNFKYKERSNQNLALFFSKHGAISSKIALAVMTTTLLVPNFLLGQYYPPELWLLLMAAYIFGILLTFGVPVYVIHMFLENLKQKRIFKLKSEYKNLMRMYEDALFPTSNENSQPSLTVSVELLMYKHQVLNWLIDEQEQTSTWPITHGTTLTIIESLIIPISIFLFETWILRI